MQTLRASLLAKRLFGAAAAATILTTAGQTLAQSAQPAPTPVQLPQTAPASQSEQQALVDAAQTTLNNFIRDPDMDWIQKHMGQARGVLVAPSILKAGYIFGGSGGRAVLFARDAKTGAWGGPAFYNVGAASVGFQAGISVSETVTLVMTEKALDTLMAPSLKLGGDASIAAGPVGAGANTDITSDFVAFSRSKGVYGGLNLEGSVINVADDWNSAYYGRSVTPVDIIVTAKARNPQAEHFLSDLDRATVRQNTSAAQ